MDFDNLIFNKKKTLSKKTDEIDDSTIEIKFYRRRIQELTKQLLYGEAPPIFLKDVENTFQLYAKTCVAYFKSIDMNDMNQEEYLFLKEDPINIANSDSNPNPTPDLSLHIFKFKQPTQLNSLEKIVKKMPCVPQPESKPFIPKQKEFNLTDPALRNKGICKKKNIETIHHEKNKEENAEKDEGRKEEVPLDKTFFISAVQSES